jgi:predicted transcriptional regulator
MGSDTSKDNRLGELERVVMNYVWKRNAVQRLRLAGF